MKKIICILLILITAASLCACGSDEGDIVFMPNDGQEQPQDIYYSTQAAPGDTGTESTGKADNPDAPFERVVVGFSGVDLPVPPYEENGTVYADLEGFASYFGASVSYDENKTLAIVNIPDAEAKYQIITFEAGKTDVSATNLSTGTTDTLTVTAAPKVTEKGFDVSVTGFADILGYSHEMKNGVLTVNG